MTTVLEGRENVSAAKSNIELRDKNSSWYNTKLKKLSLVGRELLENYSNIPPTEVEDHVYKMRDEAWEVFPYPCIGEFRFLDLALSLSPDYPAILNRLKSGNENFLDLGCCFGQELRKLVYDGVVQENLYGSDLRAEFFELGYRLFLDRDTLKSKFIEADIFDANSPLTALHGEFDIIYAASFLHLFNYIGQIKVCKELVELSREKKGSIILGRQVGNSVAGEYIQETNESGFMYKHNPESFKKMWDEVGEQTGTKWRVEHEFVLFESFSEEGERFEPGLGMLRFSVFRE